jgi:catecholate siderophore receptor
VRLNVMKQGGDVAGRDFVKKDNWAIAPSLALGLGTPTRAYFYYLHSEQDNRPDGGVTTLGLPGYRRPANTPDSVQVFQPVDSSNYYGSLGDFDRVKADMFTARIEHEFASGVVLRNTSRLGHTEQKYVLTGVNQPDAASLAFAPSRWTIARTRQGRDQQNEILTNQSHLTAQFNLGGLHHSLSTGIEFMHERQASITLSLAPGAVQAPASIYNPDVNDVFQPLFANGGFSSGTTLTAAVYAFDTVKLNEQWQVNGGLRWEKFRTEFNSATFSNNVLTRNAPLSVADSLTTWKLGALYKPAPNGSIYAAAATSMQPPGGANITLSANNNNVNNPNLKPQEGNNLELGTKWDLAGGKLALTGALFRSENKNEIVTNAAGESLQIGERRVQGVELGAVGQATATWTVSAGLALMKADITRGNAQTTGTVIPFTPEQSFTAWSTYNGLPGWTLAGGGRFYSKVGRSGSAAAGVVTEAPGYGVLDAMARYEVNKTLSLQLNLYNLADKDYLSSINNSGARYYPGKPRSALLTALFTY